VHRSGRRKSPAHYEIVGSCSPLTEVTFRQAEALRRHLAREGLALSRVTWECATGNPMSWTRSGRWPRVGAPCDDDSACPAPKRGKLGVLHRRSRLGSRRDRTTAPAIDYAGPWHAHPLFIEAVASRVDARCAAVRDSCPGPVHVLFTAHSIPYRCPMLPGTRVRWRKRRDSSRSASASVAGRSPTRAAAAIPVTVARARHSEYSACPRGRGDRGCHRGAYRLRV